MKIEGICHADFIVEADDIMTYQACSKSQKISDVILILRYIDNCGVKGANISELKQYSGADPLRIFPIVYQLYLDGEIKITKSSFWGAPEEFALCKRLDYNLYDIKIGIN